MRTFDAEFTVDAGLVALIVAEAVDLALLCPRCTQLIEQRTAAGQPIHQHEICPDCQSVINQLLQAEAERRLREALKAKGLPPDSIQVGEKQ